MIGEGEMMRGLVGALPDGVIVVDGDGSVVFVNDRMAMLSGYDREELVGSPVFALLHPDEVDDARRILADLLNGRRSGGSAERRFRTAGGRTVIARVRASVIRDDKGVPLCAVQIVEDITERRARERDLASRAAEARATLSRLTPKEIEVLELMSCGLTARQIAERLIVSVRTVESHLAGAYRKLGVRSRHDAADRFRLLTGCVDAGRRLETLIPA